MIRLYLLGGATVKSDGETVTGRAVQRRRLAVLALLALAPRRSLTRERIIAYLWPDHSPDNARRLLSEALYVLRRELGEDTISTAGDELTLSGAVWCDVDEFVAAAARGDQQRAADAYGGPLLDAWYVREAPELERWTEAERLRIGNLYARALREVAEKHEASGNWSESASRWHQLVRLDPYSSTTVFHAARSLAAAGEPAAALQMMAAHETLLEEELGVSPDRALSILAQRIRQGELAPARAIPSTPVSTVESPASPNGPVPQSHASRANGLKLGTQRFTLRALAVGIFIPLIAAAAWAGLELRASPRHPGGATTDILDRRRIAVLAFDDRSNGTLQYLSDGLTEALIDDLSRVRGLRVMSSGSIRNVRGAPLDSIARAFRVGTIVQAAIESSGSAVRVSARVIDGTSLEQVGAIVTSAPVGETFLLRDRVSGEIAAELARRIGRDVRLAEARIAMKSGARNDRALDLVFLAAQLRRVAKESRVTTGKNPADVDSARATLRHAQAILAQAESIDRSWSVPVIERGWVAMESALLESGTARVVALTPAIGYAERALALLEATGMRDTTAIAGGLYLRGLARVRSATAVQTFQPESTLIREGEEDLERAVAADTLQSGAWAALALPRWIRGDFQGVEQAASRALMADEYLENAPEVIGWAWHAAVARGDQPDAERWCARGRQQFPTDWHFVECELTIMRLDVSALSGHRPDPTRAWALVRELDRLDPPDRAQSSGHPYSPIFRRLVAAMVSAAAGDKQRARTELDRASHAVAATPELATDILYETACLNFVLGNREAGERFLAAYVRARPDLAGFIQRDATVRRLRQISR